MQDLFELTPELLLEQSQEMTSLCGDFENLFASISADLKGANDSWSDLLAHNFSGKINSAQKAFMGALTMMRNSAGSIRNVAQTAQEMDDEWASKLSDSLLTAVEGTGFAGLLGEDPQASKSLNVSSYMDKVSDAEYAALCMHWQKTVEAMENDQLKEGLANNFRKALEAGQMNGDLADNFRKALRNSKYLPENDPIKKLRDDQVEVYLSPSGFSAVTIGEGDSAIVIFGGTNFASAQDLYADAQIIAQNAGFGETAKQEKEAIALIKKLSSKHSNITVTGHSLGGYLAASSTLNNSQVDKCVAFDPPGRHDKQEQKANNRTQYDKIRTYEVKGSIVSSLGSSVGDYESVEITGDPFKHDIGKICEALNKNKKTKNVIADTWK